MTHDKPIGPSKHPHSSDTLMREARRLLRGAGCYRISDAEDYVVWAGYEAYAVMTGWLGDANPTINQTPLKYGNTLRKWQIEVARCT